MIKKGVSMTTFVVKLIDAMNQYGIKPSEIFYKDGFVRFKSEGICRTRCCYYAIFRHELGAIFGCWRRDINVKWYAKDKAALTCYERESILHDINTYKLEKSEREKAAALKAQTVWKNASQADETHAYLIKKRIRGYYARQHDNTLIVPVCNRHGEIQSLQYIHPDGFKLFHTDTTVKRGCLILAETITPVIYICEGYATGCSIYEATLATTVVAFAASNIIHIAKWLRGIYPRNRIIICADNDATGIKNATAAANAITATYITPDFSTIANATRKHTDFNDLHILAGLDAVTKNLEGFNNNDREKNYA